MRLSKPSLLVLALAFYGQPLYPPAAPLRPRVGHDGRNGTTAGRATAIANCRRWGLIDDDNKLTPRGLEVLQCSGRL